MGKKVVTDERQIKPLLREVRNATLRKEITNQSWLGRYTKQQWEMGYGSAGFPWLNGWKGCPMDVVADMEEIVQQLIPTHVYYSVKLGQDTTSNLCRLCHSKQETVSHLLSGCERLSQTEYLYRHNNVLKCLYFALLQKFGIIKTIPPPNSETEPKPVTKYNDVEILWDIPIVSSGSQFITPIEQGNRPDMVLINQKTKTVVVIECTVVARGLQTCKRKRKKRQRNIGKLEPNSREDMKIYHVDQINVLLDVMGGYTKQLKASLVALLGQEKVAKAVLKQGWRQEFPDTRAKVPDRGAKLEVRGHALPGKFH